MTEHKRPAKHVSTPDHDYDTWCDARVGELVASGGAKAEIRVSRDQDHLAANPRTAPAVLAFACYDAAGYFVGRFTSVKSARNLGWGENVDG